jgi:small multidrug resistance family-3 protein
MILIRTLALFVLTAVAEIVGCYLPFLWLRRGGSAWLILPSVLALSCFVWLLSLQSMTAGRTYAAYGGIYVVVALIWLRVIDGTALRATDIAGAAVALIGMSVIVLGGIK